MKTSREGLDLIKHFEDCRLKAYQDSVGVWTIGWGHTAGAGLPHPAAGMTITQQEADDILVRDLVKYEAAVQKALTRSPTQAQFDACVSLCYNIGPGAFAGSSVVRRFNGGDLAGAAEAFLMWTKAGGKELPGLVTRRRAERALFLTGAAHLEAVKPAPAPSTLPVVSPPPAAPRRSFWAWLKAQF